MRLAARFLAVRRCARAGRHTRYSLDFGKKAYGNLVELARLQHEVAAAVALPVGSLVIHAKSAHVYEPELETMRQLTQIAV